MELWCFLSWLSTWRQYIQKQTCTGVTKWNWCLLLTNWGWEMHTRPSFIGPDNGLLPVRHQAIIWANAGLLFIRPLGINFSEMQFSIKKINCKMLSAIWQPFSLSVMVLMFAWVSRVHHSNSFVCVKPPAVSFHIYDNHVRSLRSDKIIQILFEIRYEYNK